MAHPVAPKLSERILAAARAEQIACAPGGTYVCIEGPQFSTYAESLAYKAAGYDLIGMTALPEAKLAREAEISYATIAMVTDFDCWHPEHDDVDVAAVIEVVRANAQAASRLLARLLRDFPAEHEACPNGSDRALDNAIFDGARGARPRAAEKARRGDGPAEREASRNLISSAAPRAWVFAPDRGKMLERLFVVLALQGFVPNKT